MPKFQFLPENWSVQAKFGWYLRDFVFTEHRLSIRNGLTPTLPLRDPSEPLNKVFFRNIFAGGFCRFAEPWRHSLAGIHTEIAFGRSWRPTRSTARASPSLY